MTPHAPCSLTVLFIAALMAAAPAIAQTGAPSGRKPGLQAADIYRLRAVGDVQISPDGRTIVYAVTNNDGPGRPYSQVWQMNVASGESRTSHPMGDGSRTLATSPRVPGSLSLAATAHLRR